VNVALSLAMNNQYRSMVESLQVEVVEEGKMEAARNHQQQLSVLELAVTHNMNSRSQDQLQR